MLEYAVSLSHPFLLYDLPPLFPATFLFAMLILQCIKQKDKEESARTVCTSVTQCVSVTKKSQKKRTVAPLTSVLSVLTEASFL